jgi:hypothetical protein
MSIYIKKRSKWDEAYTGDKNKKPEIIFPEVMKIVKKERSIRMKKSKKIKIIIYMLTNKLLVLKETWPTYNSNNCSSNMCSCSHDSKLKEWF